MNNISLAIISSDYPPYSWGGIGTQTYDLAHSLSYLGTEVTVFCGGTKKPTLQVENENLKVFRLPTVDIPPHHYWFQLQNLRFLIKNLADYDVVHSQTGTGSFYAFIKKRLRKPWVVSFHHHYYKDLRLFLTIHPWKWTFGDVLLYILGYPAYDIHSRIELNWANHCIICGFSALKDFLIFNKLNLAKFTVIPNGINFDKINNIIKRKGVPPKSEGNFIIFSCGRLHVLKGFEYLIKAMPKVLKENKYVKLKIFGKGPMQSQLRALIRKLDVANNVMLQGYVSYDRLIRELYESDIAVFPTLHEVGGSIAILEAMACHKSVVAFRYPFTEEIITHLRTGFLVSPRNENKLAHTICQLLSDHKLRRKIGDKAFDYVHENHDYKKLAEKYIEVYSNLVLK